MSDIRFPSRHDGAADTLNAAYHESTAGKCGSVIVIQEIFGLTPHIRHMADYFGKAGYNALAPDFFTRKGVPPADLPGALAFAQSIPDTQLMTDVTAAADYLRRRPNSNGKVAIVGFCWGGRLAMIANAELAGLATVIVYYGGIVGEASALRPKSALDCVPQMKAPLLGHFGAKDDHITPDHVAQLRDAAVQAGLVAEIHLYPSAGHGFVNEERKERYDPEAATLSLTRSVDWLQKYL